MTGKERAYWRSKANSLEPLFQLGKGGISDAFIEQIDGALNTRELIKFKVLLETSPITPREAADEIADKTSSEVIQVIGGVIVLYRYNPKLHEDEKAKKAKKAAKAKRFNIKKKESQPPVKSKKEQKMAAQRKAAAARKLGKQ